MKMSPEIIIFIKKECVGLTVNKKNMVHLKYLILKAPYIIFSIFSWYFSFTHTKHSINYISDINNNNLSFFCLKRYK